MNRPLHFARKDARRLGPALGLWLALFPLPAALLVLHATGRVNAFAPGAPDVFGAVHQVLCAVGFLLAVQLALEDPLHHPDAHWRTRPIRLRDLLLAKLGLAFAALVAAPTLLLVLVWTAAGFAPRDIAALVSVQTTTHALLAGFGLLLGALTRDLGQALLWLAGSLAGLFLIVSQFHERTAGNAALLLPAALACIAFALCLAYRRRPLRILGGGLGFVGAILATLAIQFSPPSHQPESERASPALALVAGTEARFGSEQLRLIRIEPDASNSTPTRPVVRVEWRRLAPHFPLDSAAQVTPPVLNGPDPLALVPLSAFTHVHAWAGLRYTRHELLLPAAGHEGVTWSPAAPSTPPTAPTP